MIRRWSCLTEINSILNPSSVFTFKKSSRILIFRRSIRFKRYIKKTTITKLKRKSLIKMKHKTNWLPYFYVLRTWCMDFLFARQLTSFEYINGFFLNSFYFYNFNRVHMSNNFNANNFNFIYASITLKLYSYLNLNMNGYLHGNNLTIAFCDETPLLDKTSVPAFYDWSRQLIKFDSKFASYFRWDPIFEFLYNSSIFKIIELNKILIILFFYNFNKFKNVKWIWYYIYITLEKNNTPLLRVETVSNFTTIWISN